MFDELVTEWTAFTPDTSSTMTLGDGSWAGSAYAQTGKWVRFRVVLTFGATTSLTDPLILNLPVGVKSAANSPVGIAALYHGHTSATEIGAAITNDPDGTAIRVFIDSGRPSVDPETPWVWEAGDAIVVTGNYETV